MKNERPIHPQMWIVDPPAAEVRAVVERILRLEDVQHLAMMPDMHVSGAVCVGTVLGTSRLIYPGAIGGDIGCGYSGVAMSAGGEMLRDQRRCEQLFAGLRALIPYVRHRSLAHAPGLGAELSAARLSDRAMETALRREAAIELGTLGRGNHFLEFQEDEEGRLWVMVHSGSRAFGQAVGARHAPRSGESPAARLRGLDAADEAGLAFLGDADAARMFARANRDAILNSAIAALGAIAPIDAIEGSRFNTDHNHVVLERHGGRDLWVHRKGANRAMADEFNVIPGSMGTETVHVVGRGEPRALCSSSHGAGRKMTRTQARRSVSARALKTELRDVAFDQRLLARLTEESPSAYRGLQTVMRAQRDLVKIVRRLRPLLVYKAG